MTQKFQCGQKALHKNSRRPVRITSVAIKNVGFVYGVVMNGTKLEVLEQDLEPY